MAKINVVSSMPGLLVLMFQVGNLFLLVEGKPVIIVVCENRNTYMLLLSLLSLLHKPIIAMNFKGSRLNIIKNIGPLNMKFTQTSQNKDQHSALVSCNIHVFKLFSGQPGLKELTWKRAKERSSICIICILHLLVQSTFQRKQKFDIYFFSPQKSQHQLFIFNVISRDDLLFLFMFCMLRHIQPHKMHQGNGFRCHHSMKTSFGLDVFRLQFSILFDVLYDFHLSTIL